MQPAAVVVLVLALPAWLLSIPPLVANINAKNRATSILAAGVAVVNFQTFLNVLIWPSGPIQEKWDGKGLCDIEIKLYVGVPTAVIGAVASIFRQLATILDTDRMTIIPSKRQKNCTIMFEILFCILSPVYIMSAQIIVQPQRYWLMPVLGCIPPFDSSWLTIVLMFVWPLVVASVASIYCSLAIIRLLKYRWQISRFLSNTSSMTKARFIRLFTVAAIILAVYFPLSIYSLVLNVNRPRLPYSWSRIHPPNWADNILKFPTNLQNGSFDRWVQISTGYILFFAFGLSQDAKNMYKSWLAKIGLARFLSSFDTGCHKVAPLSQDLSGHTPLVSGFGDIVTDVEREDKAIVDENKTNANLSVVELHDLQHTSGAP